jgi:hypothetical protein
MFSGDWSCWLLGGIRGILAEKAVASYMPNIGLGAVGPREAAR